MSMQFELVPLVPEHPAVTVSVVGPVRREPLAVIVNVWPTCPWPVRVSCVGGRETAVMMRPVVQPEQDRTCPTTKGRALAEIPPVTTADDPVMVALCDAWKLVPISRHGGASAAASQPTASAFTRSSVGLLAFGGYS